MSSSTEPEQLVLGTRGSLLARMQSQWVIDRLTEVHPGLIVEMRIIKTSGDRLAGRPLPEIGGKGLFTQELEEALHDGAIDLAVHSAKDLPTELADCLEVATFPVREDPCDAWVSADGTPFSDIPQNSIVGTSSLRRQAQLLMRRPDLTFVSLRGNVDTRINKVHRGDCAGTLLAMAGLKRAGLEQHVTEVFDPTDFIPAAGQGALAIETRQDDARVCELLATIHDDDTARAVRCERSILAELDAGCHAPVGVYARMEDDNLCCRAIVSDPTGQQNASAAAHATASQPDELVGRIVEQLRRGGADDIISKCRA